MSPVEILSLARRISGLAAGAVIIADDDSDEGREALGPTLSQLREGASELADAISAQLDAAEGEL